MARPMSAGVQRHLRDGLGKHDFKLLDTKDTYFVTFRRALQARRKQLIAQGCTTATRRADPVTEDDERRLWESNVFSGETATGLSYMMYFYNCKLFGFRAMDEHVNLMADQFVFGKSQDGSEFLRFKGRLSKTVIGAIEQSERKRHPTIC